MKVLLFFSKLTIIAELLFINVIGNHSVESDCLILIILLCYLQCTATIVILCIGETHNLINYVSFINYLSYGVTIAGLLYYRWKNPSLYRPIKVSTLLCTDFPA